MAFYIVSAPLSIRLIIIIIIIIINDIMESVDRLRFGHRAIVLWLVYCVHLIALMWASNASRWTITRPAVCSEHTLQYI